MLSYNYLPTHLIASERMRSLLSRWNDLRGDLSLPAAGAISRQDLGEDFEHMSRLEVRNAHYVPRFLVAEQGSKLGEMYGYGCPGHFIDKVLPEQKRRAAAESYLKGIERKAPIYTVWKFRDTRRNEITEERLLLPFGETIFGVTEYWLAVDLHAAAPRSAWSASRRPTWPEFVIKAAIDPQPASVG